MIGIFSREGIRFSENIIILNAFSIAFQRNKCPKFSGRLPAAGEGWKIVFATFPPFVMVPPYFSEIVMVPPPWGAMTRHGPPTTLLTAYDLLDTALRYSSRAVSRVVSITLIIMLFCFRYGMLSEVEKLTRCKSVRYHALPTAFEYCETSCRGLQLVSRGSFALWDALPL